MSRTENAKSTLLVFTLLPLSKIGLPRGSLVSELDGVVSEKFLKIPFYT